MIKENYQRKKILLFNYLPKDAKKGKGVNVVWEEFFEKKNSYLKGLNMMET